MHNSHLDHQSPQWARMFVGPDLRFIKIVKLRFALVPNPGTILSAIPPNTQYFPALNLCCALFRIPLYKESSTCLSSPGITSNIPGLLCPRDLLRLLLPSHTP